MRKGFTLIELLIVITILGILSGVMLVVINPSSIMARGRDARRMDDLDSLNKAIALAVLDGEMTLTTTATCSDCTSSTGGISVDGTSGWVKFSIPSGKTGLTKFLNRLPLDPTNADIYIYTYASNGTGYELNAVLESADNLPKMTTDGGNSQERYEIGSVLNIL